MSDPYRPPEHEGSPAPEATKPSRLYRFGHVLVSLGLVYGSMVLFMVFMGRPVDSSEEFVGMVAVPAFFLGVGGLLKLLGRNHA